MSASAPDLEVGMTAPKFTLPGFHDGERTEFAIEDFLESGALLIGTYPFDFSPVCSEMMCQLSDMGWYKYKTNLSIVGVSRDSPFCHGAFAERENIGFPLLSDVDGEMIRDYDVRAPKIQGVPHAPQRAIMLLDQDRTIRYRWVADDVEDEWTNNPIEGAIEALEDL